jgi:molybdate transport system substrate-binding protein
MKFNMTKTMTMLACSLAMAASYAEVSLTTGGGYIKMVEALSKAYSAQEGAQPIKENYGGHIGQMINQIAAGNGVNVVISDKGTLDSLKAPVKFSQVEQLGPTPLVLIWRKGIELNSAEDLAKDSVKSFAYPDAKAAIYGRAAKAWMDNTKNEKINAKGMMVSSVPQVFAYVSKGEVDAGFVNRAAANQGKEKIGGMKLIENGYPPIEMVVAVVDGHEKDPQIQSFLKFLKTEKAKQILEKFGITTK